MRRMLVLLLILVAAIPAALASSHREAPGITKTPKVDATDFYVFRSYEAGRDGFVTFVADYLPLQDPYGGPNYFALDPQALYDIKVDNNGDAKADLTYRFRFQIRNKDIALQVGADGAQRSVAVPLINVGPIAADDTSALNRIETFTVELVRGERTQGDKLRNASTGATTFEKPVDNIGFKSIPDYEAYAAARMYDVTIPGCATPGRVFVGQRDDPFVVNLGETFDLVNLNPLGPVDGAADTLCGKNVTALVLEVPTACVTRPGTPVLGAWTSASVPGVPPFWNQVSRLSAPLVNEVVIGLKDKDRFNASQPRNDAQFLTYVTHPVLPELLQALFGVTAPNQFPRNDLVQAFLTGIPGLNATATPAEMLRLNTSIAPKAAAQQSALGVLGGDTAGFPNGRRPGDDVVDIELRVAMGVLLPLDVAPSGQLPYTDGAFVSAAAFDDTFPYLRTPNPGSPAEASEAGCR
ncbi:MAG TPA: DUF4331 domain-containing protein [Candidatus Polarisedimenticolaceae bacterium]|nr:DUF4331 domain-containing protein [Candidatus Polarisedimenticolaceae bacterium]